MDRLHRGLFEGPAGRVAQCTALTPAQEQYFKALAVAPPPWFHMIEPVESDEDAAPSRPTGPTGNP